MSQAQTHEMWTVVVPVARETRRGFRENQKEKLVLQQLLD